MKDPKGKRTGIIPFTEQNLAFYADGYKFNFLMAEQEKPFRTKIFKPSEDGFLCGKTYSGHDIAIYVGKQDIPVGGCCSLTAGAYFVSTSNVQETDMDGFWGMEFVGGTLDELMTRDPSALDFTPEGDLLIKQEDDTKKYTFHIEDQECVLKIRTSSTWGTGLKGVRVQDTGVHLRIEFPSRKPRCEAFRYLAIIKEMLSFMTFRGNVGFDKIFLLKEPDEHKHRWNSVQVFVRNDYELARISWLRSISFEDLGELISPLLETLIKNNDREPTYMLGFIPKSERDLLQISDSTVREVCSALECEMTYIHDLCAEEEEHLQTLIKDVKKLVKDHRKGENQLSPKTYDLIFSSVKNWSMSAGDKISMLYHRYEQEMLVINPFHIHISDDEINEFVKYRNHITHGYHRVMDLKVGATAHVLQGLVYCCLLTRIGMSREQILKLCQEHKILS